MPVTKRNVSSIKKTGSTALKGDVTLSEGSGVTLTQSGNDISIATSGGSATSTTKSVNQTTHGFAVGDVLKFSSSVYAKAQADSAANAEVVGIVSAVADADNFTLLTEGYISTLSGLTANTTYFLSASSAGALTATEPSTAGQVSVPLLRAVSTTAGHFHLKRGIVVPSATSAGIVDVQTYTSGSGTWTKPSGAVKVFVQMWGGGGSGGSGSNTNGGGGGGGGSYVEWWYKAGDLGATESYSVGAGGTAVTGSAQVGNVGGNSTFDILTAYGGGPGGGANGVLGGGGGGGQLGAGGSPGATNAGGLGGSPAVSTSIGAGGATGVAGTVNTDGGGGGGGGGNPTGAGGRATNGGGGGGGGSTVATNANGTGGNSLYGGAGGGGGSGGTSAASGGTSIYGGNGGAGSFDGGTATDGSAPGGGGGGTENGTSGNGGAGRIIVTTFI